MPRYVDADVLQETLTKKKAPYNIACSKYISVYKETILTIKSMVHGAPTVDAVPVVRCKDCCRKNSSWCLLANWMQPNDDDFCSRGAKMDKEGI